MQRIVELYRKCVADRECTVYPIAQSGSNRRYFRIIDSDNSTAIGVIGTSIKENIAFIRIAEIFEKRNIPAPQVLAVSDDSTYYIITDLGDKSLFDYIMDDNSQGDLSYDTGALIKSTIAELPRIQFEIGEDLDFSVCYPQSSFDRRNIFFDLNYFKYSFLKLVGIDFDEIALENDFEALSDVLLKSSDTGVFMYRDFQSRNIMVKDGIPCFIDFQGGRRGPLYYDLASFLWQAKANFSDEFREELIGVYLKALGKYYTISKEDFLDNLKYFVIFRQLQVLGAYGFRGLIEKKKHFVESIPFALDNLSHLLPCEEIPYISSVIEKIIHSNTFSHKREQEEKGLIVQVESFSYKRGIPSDNSDNGGGFVFDCRGIHNPGRYAEYKMLNGKDNEVRQFLLNKSDVNLFLEDVYSLIDRHIDVFIRRGFNHLSVFFGCTGGQHRSVFCAESLAKHLKSKNISVVLKHNELQ